VMHGPSASWGRGVLRAEFAPRRIPRCLSLAAFYLVSRSHAHVCSHVLLPRGPLQPDHGLKMPQRGCPAQVGEVGLQASQAVGDEERVGWGVGVEPADAAEEIEAGSHGVKAAADGT
jgi:hypothetical protein